PGARESELPQSFGGKARLEPSQEDDVDGKKVAQRERAFPVERRRIGAEDGMQIASDLDAAGVLRHQLIAGRHGPAGMRAPFRKWTLKATIPRMGRAPREASTTLAEQVSLRKPPDK